MIFRARQFEFVFPRPTLITGIVNVTPDSFSDGGRYLDSAAAVAHALKLVEQGAEILDIGGESTRPGAQPVSEAEELRRVIPVIQQLAARVKIPLSIDTLKPAVARAALEAGASIVNDVAANRTDDGLRQLVADFKAGYICMHAPGNGVDTLPASLHGQAEGLAGGQAVHEIGVFFEERLRRLGDCGVARDQVVLDVGIGFGKTLEQNLQLLASLKTFTTFQRPLLLGVSRKSFIGQLLGAAVNERLPASLVCASLAVESGVQIVRAHDVAETIQAVRLTEAVLARKKK